MSQTVTLPDFWLLIAPCGCIDGMRRTTFEGRVITATAQEAWEKFTPRKRDRDKELRDGFTCRGSEDGEDITLGCSHDPQWTAPEAVTS